MFNGGSIISQAGAKFLMNGPVPDPIPSSESNECLLSGTARLSSWLPRSWQMSKTSSGSSSRVRGSGEKYKIYAAAFGDHLFNGRWGLDPTQGVMKTMVDCHESAISTFEQIDLEENQSPTQSPQSEVPVLVGVVGWGTGGGSLRQAFTYSKSLSPYLRNTFYESQGRGRGGGCCGILAQNTLFWG